LSPEKSEDTQNLQKE